MTRVHVLGCTHSGVLFFFFWYLVEVFVTWRRVVEVGDVTGGQLSSGYSCLEQLVLVLDRYIFISYNNDN